MDPIIILEHMSQTRGPRAACGPPDVFVRPATSLKLLKLLLKLLFFVVSRHFQPPIVARGDIFPLNAAREPFFVKMWPAYESEFETPILEVLDGKKTPLYTDPHLKTYALPKLKQNILEVIMSFLNLFHISYDWLHKGTEE